MTAAREAVEIAMLVPLGPQLAVEPEHRFVCHQVHAEADPLACLREHGGRMRDAVTHGMGGISTAQLDTMPNLEICAIMGIGLETSDVAGCRERGVALTITPVLYDDAPISPWPWPSRPAAASPRTIVSCAPGDGSRGACAPAASSRE